LDMRITEQQRKIITQSAAEVFGSDVEVRLFGSRTNDLARGGDIDIQVVAPNSTYRDELAFLVAVDRELDERVDLRVQRGDSLLIDEVAFNEGILLNGS
jgi:predicted nucleotidyltransferase